MFLLLTLATSSWAQLITVLLIFIFVLAITAWVTKWIANFQKEKAPGENIVVLESKRVATNKIVEIVRIADKVYALGIGKDEITLIGEVNADALQHTETAGGTFSFKDFLEKAKDNGVEKQ